MTYSDLCEFSTDGFNSIVREKQSGKVSDVKNFMIFITYRNMAERSIALLLSSFSKCPEFQLHKIYHYTFYCIVMHTCFPVFAQKQ